jgi:hypothetical protein
MSQSKYTKEPVSKKQTELKSSGDNPKNKDGVSALPKGSQPVKSQGTSSQEQTEGKFTCIDDIPSDLSELSVERITDCLHLLNMSHHIRTFKRYCFIVFSYL